MLGSKEKKKSPQSSWDVYVDKYVASVERLYSVGGFPLVVFCTGVVLLVGVAVGSNYFPPVANSLLWLAALSVLVAITGVVLHLAEGRRRERAIQRSLDQYHEMITMLWRTYLDGYKGDFRDAQLSKAMEELNTMLSSTAIYQEGTAQQGAPADAEKRRG